MASKRARRGSKLGWTARTAKFRPAEDHCLHLLAAARGWTLDRVIHDAVVREIERYPELGPLLTAEESLEHRREHRGNVDRT